VKHIARAWSLSDFLKATAMRRFLEFCAGTLLTFLLYIALSDAYMPADQRSVGHALVGAVFAWFIIYIAFGYFFISSLLDIVAWFLRARSPALIGAIAPVSLAIEGAVLYLDARRGGTDPFPGFWPMLVLISLTFFFIGVFVLRRWKTQPEPKFS
jgi:hypothetical protein